MRLRWWVRVAPSMPIAAAWYAQLFGRDADIVAADQEVLWKMTDTGARRAGGARPRPHDLGAERAGRGEGSSGARGWRKPVFGVDASVVCVVDVSDADACHE